VIHTFNPSYSGVRVRRILVQARQKCEALPEKQTNSETIGEVVKVVEHLPRKYKALSSVHSTTQKRKEKKR
jgi:hypothetical protein